MLGLLALLAGIVLAIWSVWTHPALRLPASVREFKGQLKTDIAKHPDTALNRNTEKWKTYLDKSRSVQSRIAQMRAVTGKTPTWTPGEVRLGFYSRHPRCLPQKRGLVVLFRRAAMASETALEYETHS